MSDNECHICCESYDLECKYQCNHIFCYKCASRLIFLYKDSKCPICKSLKGKPTFRYRSGYSPETNLGKEEKNYVSSKTFLENVKSKPEYLDKACTLHAQNEDKDKALQNTNKCFKPTLISLDDLSFASVELTEHLKNFKLDESEEDADVIYENKKIAKIIKDLLAIRCKECSAIYHTKKELMGHVKNKHSVMLCSTCLDNNHQFWYEYSHYSPETLGQHRRGQSKEHGFEGHIFCSFCNLWLYNKDTAKKHCYQEHQICTVCDILGKKLQFYKNYAELENHYQVKHYCCSNVICRKNHCYVYAYKSELCAHSIAHHGLEMQIADIVEASGKNPSVLSLQEKNSTLEQESLFTTGVNIVNPLVDEPFFPSFSRDKKPGNSSTVPSFLNRQIIHEADGIKRQRENIIKDISPNFYTNISTIIEKYISNVKPLHEMIAEIEECVDKEKTLRILQKVSFLQKQKEISEFSVEYKKKLKFPSFKKETKTQVQPVKKPMAFRIIDFTKKK